MNIRRSSTPSRSELRFIMKSEQHAVSTLPQRASAQRFRSCALCANANQHMRSECVLGYCNNRTVSNTTRHLLCRSAPACAYWYNTHVHMLCETPEMPGCRARGRLVRHRTVTRKNRTKIASPAASERERDLGLEGESGIYLGSIDSTAAAIGRNHGKFQRQTNALVAGSGERPCPVSKGILGIERPRATHQLSCRSTWGRLRLPVSS